MHSLFLLIMPCFFLPHFSKRNEIEADYIGLLLTASAGYDPLVAPKVREKLGKIKGDFRGYFSTHPPRRKRAEFLAQAKMMEEALSIYRNVKVHI
ncbi:Mitochondrial metalloendopeptidase OMA1 [Spatholobus suberectus]|nr:Mitochondrial metalloendopeptidase OMA1 [Spatholobus suberectus]